MRTFKYLLFISVWLFLQSCKKDGEQINLGTGSFAANTLTTSVTNLELSQDTENDTVIRFDWTAADFGTSSVITYTLQLDVPEDTATGWLNATSITIQDNQVLHYAFTGKDLNSLLTGRGMAPGVSNTILARVKADVNQYTGAASTVPPAYTNVATQQITSYAMDLYVPGDYQGWDPSSAPKLAAVPDDPGLYEGYIYMPGSGTHYFKYTNFPDWDHTNYGDGGSGMFSTDGNAAGLSVPDGGYYYLTANLNDNTWTATLMTWGIIGDATPGGWSADTEMSYDEASQTWKVTADMLKNGSFKFRANQEWVYDFGIDGNGDLAYADNYFLGYTDGINNITVPEDGNYTITLDLHVAGSYSYSLQKN